MKGSNNDGVWNELGTQLRIFITPPYWQTGWFRILCLIAVVLSIMGVFKWRTRILRAEKKGLEQKVKKRTVEIVKQKEEIEKEKQKSDELLLNILPAEVMEELKSTGKTQARNYDLVTVLFADFKDFLKLLTNCHRKNLFQGLIIILKHLTASLENILLKK
ncbi:MAG TPA: hypothetical protein VJY62_03455 [Bacteroidia bacterium]|nr:hypothetical protein [Bacteroidia bacterium]